MHAIIQKLKKMSNTPIISQTKLDMLLERVCRPIDYLSIMINSATPLWDGPIMMCQQIESDQFAVDSVALEAKRYNSLFNGASKTRHYHAILCRVYIILYYLHRDEILYKEIVFPRLLENMGLYKSNHLNRINEQIDKIRAQEELMEKVRAEKKKEVKPLFAYVPHNGNEQDNMFIEYNEEQLFRSMSGVIKHLSNLYDTNQDEANVWFNAKRVVHTLRDVNHPELLIGRAAIALVAGQLYNGYEGSQIILLCAYMMIRASENNAHFDLFIKKMESLSDDNVDTDLTVIERSIKYIKKLIDEQTFDGYDYIGEQTSKGDIFTSSDLERMQKQIQSKEDEKRLLLIDKIEDLQKQISEKDAQLRDAENTCAQLESQLGAKGGDDMQEMWKMEKEDIIVELLTPIFNNKRENAKSFAEEVDGCDDIEIIEIVGKYVKQQKATKTSVHRKLWSILHAFKIYNAGESNWNLTLKQRI